MLSPAGSTKVLVVRSDNAGDVLLSGPAVRAVAAGCEHLTYCCSPQGAAAARLLPGVDDVVVEAMPWIDADPGPVGTGDVGRLVDRFASIGARRAVIFTSFHQSPLPLALLLRAAGYTAITANSVDYPGSLLDVRVTADDGLHEVDRALAIAAAAGFVLPATDDRRLAITDHRGAPVAGVPDEPYVVVHPGASVAARAWSPARMAGAVRALGVRGHRVVVTGAGGERALTAAVAGASSPAGPPAVDLGGRTSLRQLAGVLATAGAVVVANTGPAHLAAAVGTPVVSIYAPTVPSGRWRPWMVPSRLLGDQAVPCAGCRAKACPVPGHPCLGSISPADVADAVEALAAGAVLAR